MDQGGFREHVFGFGETRNETGNVLEKQLVAARTTIGSWASGSFVQRIEAIVVLWDSGVCMVFLEVRMSEEAGLK